MRIVEVVEKCEDELIEVDEYFEVDEQIEVDEHIEVDGQ